MLMIRKPNEQQIQSLIRLVLAAGGPVSSIAVRHGMTPGTMEDILSIALMVVPPLVSLVWSMSSHSQESTLTDASNIPGVNPIRIDMATASPGAKDAVASPDSPKVIRA